MISTSTANRLQGIADESNGTIVYQRHLHESLKDAGFHRNTSLARPIYKIFVKVRSHRRAGCHVEAGAAAFSAIAVEGKLRYKQQAAAGLTNTQIHPAGWIWKNPQVDELLYQVIGVLFRVCHCYTQKNQETQSDRASNFASYLDARLFDPLDDDSHYETLPNFHSSLRL